MVGAELPGNLYWMAISGTLSFTSATAAFASRRPGIFTLCCGTATFSSPALAMDSNRHHWCGVVAGDSFSHRCFCSANADAQFSAHRSADRQGDDAERPHLCLGKFAATLQFFRSADGDAFRELNTLGRRLR